LKLVKVGRKSKSLYGSFLWMTLLPICVAGLVMILVCTYSVREGISTETEDNLRNVATSVLVAYDTMYEGDYNVTISGSRTTLWKGDNILSGQYDYLDRISGGSDVDVSIFFYDTRLLTTIKDDNGNRVTDTGLNAQVFEEVFVNGHESFYDNVKIAGTAYFAYYAPVFASDNETIIGIIGVAKPSSVVGKAVNKSVIINLIVIFVAMVITAFFILNFATKIVSTIKKMMDFLKELSENNLNVTLDEGVSHRGDELGAMGRFMIKLQGSLKKLIERDVLTGLYNRRSAERQIDEIEDLYGSYCVAIGDIDHFKNFNDSFGHECGDVVLKEVARILNESMHNKGFVARWGGEEFLLVYPGADIDTAYIALLEIRDELHRHEIEYNGQIHKVTMTFGVSAKEENVPINQLIRQADDKLYDGKQGGRDRVCK